jgi:hypothetical protein
MPLLRRAMASARLRPDLYAVDTEGKTREDYQQDLLLHAWQTFGDTPVDAPLLFVALRNRARNLVRNRRARTTLRAQDLPDPDHLYAHDAAFQRTRQVQEAQASMACLVEGLRQEHLRVLRAQTEHPTWAVAASAVGMGRATFALRLKHARREAYRLLTGHDYAAD